MSSGGMNMAMTRDVGARPRSSALAHPRDGERGASLIIALAVLVCLGVIGAAVATYAQVSISTTRHFRNQRDERAAGEGAVNAAINWAKKNPKVAVDPALGVPGTQPCLYTVPASGSVPAITVTCDTPDGSGSGTPTDTGLTPDQAMVLLGRRYGEVPRYSPCTERTGAGVATPGFEAGLRFDAQTVNSLSTGCTEPANQIGQMNITGDILSNSPVYVDDGQLSVNGKIVAGTSPLAASATDTVGRACAVTKTGASVTTTAGACQRAATVRTRGSASGDARSPWDPGETVVTDPALAHPSEWTRGTINWSKGRVAVNNGAPVTLDSDTAVTTIGSQCTAVASGAPKVIKFYPGWYDSARLLNNVFDLASCANGTFWFQPKPGNDAETPMTSTSKQGVYLFDFRDSGAGTGCGRYVNTNYPHRWCLSKAAEAGPKVVAGWPKGWEPGSSTTTITGTEVVNMTTAGTVEGAFLTGWTNISNAKTLDDGGAYAHYSNFLPSFTDRRLTFSNWGPQVATGGYNREIILTVRHRETGTNLGTTRMRIETTAAGSTIDCGNFVVPHSPDGQWATHEVRASGLNAADRQRLQSCFTTAERANNVQVSWHVEGTWTSWNGSSVDVDGIRIGIETPKSTWFDDSVARPAVYCDDHKPGVQLIFGGDSTVQVSGSVLHVCAGPTDTNPQQHQQIAIWGEPGLGNATGLPVGMRPTSVVSTSGYGTVSDPTRVLRPGDQYRKSLAEQQPITSTLQFNGSPFLDPQTRRLTVVTGGYPAVQTSGCSRTDAGLCLGSDLKIQKVELKVGYETSCGEFLPALFGQCNTGASPEYKIQNAARSTTYCSGTLAPSNSVIWGTADITSCFNLGAGRTLTRLNDLAVEWSSVCGSPCYDVGQDLQDQLEGVELLVTVGPASDTTQTVVPATGCRNTTATGYGAGSGNPSAAYNDAREGRDCALISGGRVAVMGTIYAPSDALEINDTAALYPLASRGLVARHLRVRAYKYGSGYSGPTVTTTIDSTTGDRDTVFVACIRSASSTAACGSAPGDRVLTKSRVVLHADGSADVRWFSTVR